jgi:ABC-type dipeptide transport system, periplasmic component
MTRRAIAIVDIFAAFVRSHLAFAPHSRPGKFAAKSRWFATKEFRQAIAYGINRDAMTNNIYRGLGAPLHSPIPAQSPFYLSPKAGLKTYNYDQQKSETFTFKCWFQV